LICSFQEIEHERKNAMNRVVDVLLRKVFSDYKLAPAQNKGEINVVNLRLNPEADVFGFLRSLPVQITGGTAASVTLSGVSFLSILRDVWRAYRNNQVDLALKVKVSDVSSEEFVESQSRLLRVCLCYAFSDAAVTIRPKADVSVIPSKDVIEELLQRKLKEVERTMARLITLSKLQWSVEEDEESLPSRIADAILQRIQV
jgi:hypothetical protein